MLAGLVSNSLAILTDAAHLLSDVAGEPWTRCSCKDQNRQNLDVRQVVEKSQHCTVMQKVEWSRLGVFTQRASRLASWMARAPLVKLQ